MTKMPDHRKKKGSKAQKQYEAEKQSEAHNQCDGELHSSI
jgi:hypothetical protein